MKDLRYKGLEALDCDTLVAVVEEGDKEWTKRHSAELNEVESFLHGMVRKAR